MEYFIHIKNLKKKLYSTHVKFVNLFLRPTDLVFKSAHGKCKGTVY